MLDPVGSCLGVLVGLFIGETTKKKTAFNNIGGFYVHTGNDLFCKRSLNDSYEYQGTCLWYMIP